MKKKYFACTGNLVSLWLKKLGKHVCQRTLTKDRKISTSSIFYLAWAMQIKVNHKILEIKQIFGPGELAQLIA